MAAIRWQIQMSKNPKVDPATDWSACLEYWNDLSRLETVYALVLHEGSLFYPDPKSLVFEFRLSLKDVKDRAFEAAEAKRKAAKAAAKSPATKNPSNPKAPAKSV